MAICWQEEVRPGAALHSLVQEATTALIAMDAERLEELARCCADLNRELHASGTVADTANAIALSRKNVDLLGRILVETRANLVVLSRLHAIHLRRRLAVERCGENQTPAFSNGISFCSGEFYGDN